MGFHFPIIKSTKGKDSVILLFSYDLLFKG